MSKKNCSKKVRTS